MARADAFTTIDAYIAQFSPAVQERLNILRKTIGEAAPKATEKMSWAMPTFYLNGNLIHFAAFKNHIGLYPGAEGIEMFRHKFDESGLRYSKGAVQLPNAKPLPLDLITEIVRFRVLQNDILPSKKQTK